MYNYEVTRATMVVRLLCASQSWFGFLKAADLHRLENLIHRAKRCNYLPEDSLASRPWQSWLTIPYFNQLSAIQTMSCVTYARNGSRTFPPDISPGLSPRSKM